MCELGKPFTNFIQAHTLKPEVATRINKVFLQLAMLEIMAGHGSMTGQFSSTFQNRF